ncbi:hypothetical protein [Salegentibacter sp. T436]|uniref:hypothetical protein n=1 Tax=Salegentibacter sp. T436 TaxID=1729720 RepID=UPI0012EC6152|nr:hypothetical protein [Salegentibacter sp. T436]
MKKNVSLLLMFLFLFQALQCIAQEESVLDSIKFFRQGVYRPLFEESQNIPLATFNPKEVIEMSTMYPTTHYLDTRAVVNVIGDRLSIKSSQKTKTSIWFGGFNPFATYLIDVASVEGEGEIGLEFSDSKREDQFFITVAYKNENIIDVRQKITKAGKVVQDTSIATSSQKTLEGKLIVQMLGSGVTLYIQNKRTSPEPIGQSDFSKHIDLRKKRYIRRFQSKLYSSILKGEVNVSKARSVLGTGIGLADIRAITYEDGEPLLDQNRLWYTISIRGRALPHHIQGVFSLNPTVFDIKFEGVILFDRNDGLLRNEIASHIFFDRKENMWRGITTGFSAFANPEEEKQLLTVESKRDPRFGFSIMKAKPFGVAGDIEDPHILYDSKLGKWLILASKNYNGYKAIMMESNFWNKGYKIISGPVSHNSTGTSIQKVGGVRYCFSGSDEREVFIYSYPDLREIGTLNINQPPWNEYSGTRVWPNVVELPEGYPFKYVALMMDRINYPGLEGPHWSYGALYLYHGSNTGKTN